MADILSYFDALVTGFKEKKSAKAYDVLTASQYKTGLMAVKHEVTAYDGRMRDAYNSYFKSMRIEGNVSREDVKQEMQNLLRYMIKENIYQAEEETVASSAEIMAETIITRARTVEDYLSAQYVTEFDDLQSKKHRPLAREPVMMVVVDNTLE